MKNIAIDAIKEKAELFTNLSDDIWGFAELSLQEYESADKYCEVLSELGF
jgi:aminobenzoyl-glutamate utilization protein B